MLLFAAAKLALRKGLTIPLHTDRINLVIAVLMLVKCIRVGAIRQFALRSVLLAAGERGRYAEEE